MTEAAPAVFDTFFRHEYGRLVAVLSRRVGLQHIESVEDAVQATLERAWVLWAREGRPNNPAAWLTRAAHNALLGQLRKEGRRRQLLAQGGSRTLGRWPADPPLKSEMGDELLRMLFACCDHNMPWQSQMVFALKILCGFSVREVAVRLFTTEANVYKRLSRARTALAQRFADPEELLATTGGADETLDPARLPAVRRLLYTLFTEGHLSIHPEALIRSELCHEALRLARSLAEHPLGNEPETAALIALMLLHLARLPGRRSATGGLLLLEEQDRSLWDQGLLAEGLAWLARSAQGDVMSRYHAEAGIAAEHGMAPSFQATRWDRIAELYELVERSTASPIHRLNRALAVAEWKGPQAALALIGQAQPPTWLAGSYLWAASLADLYARSGLTQEAAAHRKVALATAPSAPMRELLSRRLRGH